MKIYTNFSQISSEHEAHYKSLEPNFSGQSFQWKATISTAKLMSVGIAVLTSKTTRIDMEEEKMNCYIEAYIFLDHIYLRIF